MRRVTAARVVPMLESLETRKMLSAGDLDVTFGTGGRVLTDLGLDGAGDVAVRPNGKIVVAAYRRVDTSIDVLQYNADGSLDTSFGGGDGLATSDLNFSGLGLDRHLSLHQMALLDSGKIIVAGQFSAEGENGYFAARLNADGSLDATFGDDGVAYFSRPIQYPPAGEDQYAGGGGAAQLAVQADGRLVLAWGKSTGPNDGDLEIVRLTAGGALDASFGTGGVVTRDLDDSIEIPADLVIDDDGRIVVAVDGNQPTSTVYGTMAMAPNVYLLRLNADGSADSSFGVGGVVTEHVSGGTINGYELAIDGQGRLLLLGEQNIGEMVRSDDGETPDPRVLSNVLFRYEADGDRDATFGTGGRQVLSVINDTGASFGEVLPLADGTILLSGGTMQAGKGNNDGNSGLSVRRLNADGTVDTSYGQGGTVRYEFGGHQHAGGGAMALDGDGNLIVAGTALKVGRGDAVVVRLEGEPAGGVRRSAKQSRKAAKLKAKAAAKAKAELARREAERRKERRAARRAAKEAAELKAKQEAKRAAERRRARRAARLAAQQAGGTQQAGQVVTDQGDVVVGGGSSVVTPVMFSLKRVTFNAATGA